MDQEELHLEELLQTYRRWLHLLEKQAAQFGARTDPAVLTEIEDIRHKILLIENQLGISEPQSLTLDSVAPYKHEIESRARPHTLGRWRWAIIAGATALFLSLTYVVATYMTPPRASPTPIPPSAAAPATPTVPSTAPPASPTTVAVSSPEWSSIARVTILDGSSNARAGDITCFHPLILPDHIIPTLDAVAAGKQVAEAIENGSALEWRRAPLKDKFFLDVIGFELPIEIASIVGDGQSIRLDNTIRVTVTVRRELAEKVNVLRSCQGTGEVRDFPIVSLNSNARQYTVEAVYSGADFFTLLPGEFEEFYMKFRCDSPGVYTIRMELPYRYRVRSDTIVFSHADLVCPVSYFEWSRDSEPPNKLVGGSFYVWNEGDYEPRLP